ncbi:MAG: redoxin family protein [Acidaminobacteraceae bacterium]
MNKKLIGIVLALALVGLVALNGFRGSNNNEVMDDDTKISNEEIMDKDEMKEDEMKEDESIMEDSKDDEMVDLDIKVELMKNDGDMAKDFTLKNLNGDDVMLSSLQGEKVYIKFWASWCSICLAGLEDIDMLAGQDDFRVITIVSPGYNGEKNTDDFKEWFVTRETKNLEVLLDEGGAVTKAYGVRAYPTSVYIGSDGVLIKVLPGHNSNDNIKAFFENIH